MASSEQGHLLSVPEKPRIIYAGEPKDFTLWDRNKETLRLLYLDQNCSLKDVKRRMETEYQFPILPRSEYEIFLRDRFHFRKKVGRSVWGPIGYRIEKRRRARKGSQVYLGLKLLAPESVAKEIRRYKLKDEILHMFRQGLSPPLPDNVIVRSPSPQPTQYVVTMDLDHEVNAGGSMLANNATQYATRVSRNFVIRDMPTMTDKHARLEAITAIKSRSPFNKFLTLLHKLMSSIPSSGQFSRTVSGSVSYSALANTANSSQSAQPSSHCAEFEYWATLSAPNAEVLSDPSQTVFHGGTTVPTKLAQACFAVSNGNGWSSTFTRNLLEWIEISAEPSDLKSFFSIKAHTITAIWENLVDSSVKLYRKTAFKSLIDSALSNRRNQWIMRRSGEILNMGVQCDMLHTVQQLLTLGVPHDTPGVGRHDIEGTPLRYAVTSFQADMVNILCQYGADVNFQPIKSRFDGNDTWADAPLIILINARSTPDDADKMVECAQILLDKGAHIDICRKSKARRDRNPSQETQDLRLLVEEWVNAEGARWCTDYAWRKLGPNHGLVQVLLERSERAQTHVTVPGIITQARKGLNDLQIYLEKRQLPLVNQNGTALLEVALLWAARLDDFDALHCLLQFGVDPKFGTIASILKDIDVRNRHPLSRALWSNHDLMASILKVHGVNHITTHPTEQLHTKQLHAEPLQTKRHQTTLDIERALVHHNHCYLQSMKLSDSDIETHGKKLLQIFLSHAKQKNFVICAYNCDVLWSRGVPKDIKCAGGRDVLHFAISQHCCVAMCEFLIARGYKVHSYPSEVVPGFLYSTTMLGDAVTNFRGYLEDDLKVIEFLLEHNASTDSPPQGLTLLESVLEFNSFEGYVNSGLWKLFEKLMASGASVDPPPRRRRTPPWLSVLCKLISVEADDDLIFRIINASEDVDQRGYPLAMALQYGRAAVVESLLSRGAKVNHPPRIDFQGVLQAACSPVTSFDAQKNVSTHFRLIERLITLGADVNGSAELSMGGSAPLHHAAYEGLIEVACLLMKHGAHVNARGRGPKDRPTRALDYAAMNGRLDMVHLL